MAGKKWRFWPKSAIFFPVNNSIIFPAITKNPPIQLCGFLGAYVMTLCTLLLICSINIVNYLFEQYMPNNTNCATKGSIFDKSETKIIIKDKVIIF